MRRSSGAVVIVVGALALAGCIFSFQQPTLHVAEVRLKQLGLSGGTVAVRLDIVNPNGYDLQSADFQYQLSFSDGGDTGTDWVTLAEGQHGGQIVVPAHDSASVQLDVPFDVAAVTGALGRLLRRGELDYRFTGELQVTEPRRARVPFNLRGVFRP